MDHTVQQVGKYMKRGVAAVLFTVLLLGASAAALSALAAGMNALSNVRSDSVPSVPTMSSETSGAPSATASASTITAQGNVATQNEPPQTVDKAAQQETPAEGPALTADNRLDVVPSPLVHSLNHGGIALGEQVQQTFGHVLSGVMQALFLQSGPSGETGK